jgi:hypothetical protein
MQDERFQTAMVGQLMKIHLEALPMQMGHSQWMPLQIN